MSMIRESERLERLALRLNPEKDEHSEVLRKAVDYVIGFNRRGLERVEDAFFPWMKQHVSKGCKDGKVVAAFSTIIDHLEEESQVISKMAGVMSKAVSADAHNPNLNREVASASQKIAKATRAMLKRELTYLMPTVANTVPESEQNKFNNRVITMLGVFDSRLHLVHMHEVVRGTKNKMEEELWKEAIPSLPRSLIPHWRRSLYLPKAGVLDF